MIQQISDYVHKHEKLVLGIALLGVVLYLGNRWLNYSAMNAASRVQTAETALEQQKKVVSDLTAALKFQKDISDLAMAQSEARVEKLESDISSLRSGLVAQQEHTKTIPLPELTAEWNKLIQIPDGVVNSTDGIIVGDESARTTVSQLEAVPVLTKIVNDQDNQIVEKNKQISTQQDEIKACDNLVSGLRTQMSQTSDTCKKEVALAKAVSRKSKRNWFIAGFAAGIATRILAHF